MTATRDRILEIAAAEIGPGRRADYWVDALGYDPGKAKAWCGAFCLFVLHQAGLAREHKWGIDGSGMVGPLHLKPTRTPSRGDIGYLDQPFQHHFLFDREHDGWVYSIDGNQPDVREKKRWKEGLVFFSIEPLLGKAAGVPDLSGVIRQVDEIALPEAGFLRGQTYSVPGIQDVDDEETKP